MKTSFCITEHHICKTKWDPNLIITQVFYYHYQIKKLFTGTRAQKTYKFYPITSACMYLLIHSNGIEMQWLTP